MYAARLLRLYVVVYLSLSASPAAALPVLDGVYGWENPGEAYVPYVGYPTGLQPAQYAQTFSITNTGIFAAAEFVIQLSGQISNPLNVQLFQGLPSTNGAAILTSPLASVTLPVNANGDVRVDFSSFSLPVTSGQTYSLVFLSGERSSNLGITAANHAGVGGLYVRLPLNNQTEQYSGWHYDYSRGPVPDTLRLRTYVETSAVPEPSAFTLLALGVIMLTLLRVKVLKAHGRFW